MNLSKTIRLNAIFFIVLSLVACSKKDQTVDTTALVVKVESANFITAGLSEPISIVSRTLSNGSTADCFKIVSKSTPTDHSMGPWCPSNITDDKSKGGIWLENGNVYDVDGAFVKNLATFYNNTTWQMYNTSTGVITKTLTQADCQAAANPNVGVAYKNYCVECLPSYVSTLTKTVYIPVTPVKLTAPISFGAGPMSSGPSVRGIAFNGVVFDAPAPVNAILGAYTLAPFDDAGGHINIGAGYHYHAAMGVSKKIAQTDGHAAMIGYALDGFGMYERLSASGTEYTDLDASRGHSDTIRGYHYHVDKAGANNFINSLAGAYAN
ncbi:MAG: phospholipid-binding protein [Bacteroidetes bacterium 24-39-8]|nr:MAG: phospholipid-binding protein [Bacteroidetes bacterium 24-39-8]OZA63197.1 MAG: phospholipid-binding protein [Sphingobacteriia bacterium 39-39-8]HQR94244.1 YHYH protein [Sediminibacterium sp.]HQS54483.1 YHYH protein [Sediminibacterium sp.]